jgi:flagellar basal-body rod protein FlgG
MTQTGNKLDIAIQGRGYLQVLMPTGELAYTRAGNLSLNDQGQLVTADGYQIQPAIVIPPDAVDVSISKSGQIQIKQAGQPEPSVAGTLELATFVNEGGLEAIGDNLYLESGSSGAPNLSVPGVDGTGVLLQGYTEASNVDAVAEVTALIVAQRAYEMNSKVITSADQMLSTANQVKS